MAGTAVANGTDAPKRGRAKKGEGPYTISFVDNESKDHSRVPASVSSIKIADKDGENIKAYSLAGLPAQVITQLAADGLKRKVDAFVRNSIGGDKSAIVLADEIYKQIADGKLYARKEGAKGPGRSFNVDFYVEVTKRTAELLAKANPKMKPATQKQLEAVKVQLLGMSAQERNEKIKKHKTNAIYSLALKQVSAERAQAAVEKSGDTEGLENLF